MLYMSLVVSSFILMLLLIIKAIFIVLSLNVNGRKCFASFKNNVCFLTEKNSELYNI